VIRAQRALGMAFLAKGLRAVPIGLLLAAVPAMAQEGDHRQPVILNASADPQLVVLAISGQNFGDQPPVVVLDSVPGVAAGLLPFDPGAWGR
jgi:hypothetical protein